MQCIRKYSDPFCYITIVILNLILKKDSLTNQKLV